MAFALALCGLCTWQWIQQVRQNDEVRVVLQTVYDQKMSIQGYTNTISSQDKQIAQMSQRMDEMKDNLASNRVSLAGLTKESQTLSNNLISYKLANSQMQDEVRMANESIKKQNEIIKEVAAQRDEFVKQLNAAIKERNDVVSQYNDLVQKFKDFQASLTNKPAHK
jgi:chromosome segregation ATPase